MNKRIVLGILTVLNITVFAQQENNIDPVEIKVVKDYNVFIEEASKIHEPINYYPKFKEKTTQKKLVYKLPDRIEQFKFEPSTIEPIAFKQRNIFFQNTNFVRMGFGSSFNPIFEWSHHNEKSKTPSRVHVFHHSAWRSPDSFQKYSESKAEAEITKSFKNWIFKPRLNLQHKYYNFYGNLAESGFKDEATRNYFNGGISAVLQRESSEQKSISIINTMDLNFGLDKLGLVNLTRDNHEFYANLKSELSYKLKDDILLKLQGGGQYYNFSADTFTDKWIAHLMPQVEYRSKALKIVGGLNLSMAINNSKQTYYGLPYLNAEVEVVPNFLNVYAIWKRNLELNRMQNHFAANPFIVFTNQLLPNTIVESRGAGLKGVYRGISYQANFIQKVMKDALLFRNDAVNPRFLNSQIENQMTINNISLELTYMQEERWSTFIKGDIFLYDISRNPAIAYNLPGQRLTLGANLKASKKLNFFFNGFAVGGVKTEILGNEITNPILFDLNLGLEYHISKNFYIFANGNNLLDSKIANQIGFPTIGINGQGGVRITY
ncbi:MAG: TonB-dependent receptor [Chitinophagales bacterium]|nr:TonB-dependent receptor [Chitinophagales bacterium]